MDLVKVYVHHGPKVKPKNTEEPTIPIKKYGLWKPKMSQNMLKEDIMSGFCFNNILIGYQNSCTKKVINNNKKHIFYHTWLRENIM